MENILILGGAGYTGSALTHLLVSKKYNVTVVDNFLFKEDVFNTLFKFENFNVIKKDVRDIEESFIKKFDVIFPLAAYDCCQWKNNIKFFYKRLFYISYIFFNHIKIFKLK